MTCAESPRARSHADEYARVEPDWTFAGIIGDQSHQQRTSGHNCAPRQESPLTDPRTGQTVAYPPDRAHALDETYWDDVLGAAERENQCLLGPRSLDFRYTIDHRTGRLRYPPWRGGGTGSSSAGHPHLHHSYTPWASGTTTPVFGPGPMTAAVRRRLLRLARTEARRRRLLEVKAGRPFQHGRDVAEVQAVLGRPVSLPYGHGTARAVGELQAFFGARPTGIVDRKTWTLILFVYLAHGFGY